MTDSIRDLVARLREMEGRATGRPWESDEPDPVGEFWSITGPGGVRLFDEPRANSESGSWSVADTVPADCDLIASLRNAAPTLIALAELALEAAALTTRLDEDGEAPMEYRHWLSRLAALEEEQGR